MSFQQFFFILRARYRLLLLVLLGTIGFAVAVSLLLPARYSAQASVVVDVKSPDPIAGMLLPALAIPLYITAQADIINSERVAQRVVRMLKLDQSESRRQEWLEETEGLF